MVLSSDTNIKTWKAMQDKSDNIAVLYDVPIPDGTTLYLMEGNPTGTGSLVYQGHTYSASNIERQVTTQSIEGEMPVFRVAVSNIDRIAGSILELYDMAGTQITMHKVLLSTLIPLAEDDFSAASLNTDIWNVVDEPGADNAPSAWAYTAGELAQTSNIGLIPQAGYYTGSHLVYKLGDHWTDYTVEYDRRSTDDDGLGLCFRYTDENNFYLFYEELGNNRRHLGKMVAGAFTQIEALTKAPYVQSGPANHVRITCSGSSLKVWVDDVLEHDETDTAHTQGTIAFHVHYNAGSYFDNLMVTDVSTLPDETYTIQNTSYDQRQANFELGHTNLFKRDVPATQFVRIRCQHPYERRFRDNAGCGYPSDQFGPDTAQDLVVGRTANTEEKRLYGWHTRNALRPDVWDSDMTLPDQLYFEITGSGIEWNGTTRTAPYLYKKITGDLDVQTEFSEISGRTDYRAGILCQSQSQAGSWVFFAHTIDDDSIPYLQMSSAANSVEGATVTTLLDFNFLRLARVGDVFTAYYAVNRPLFPTPGTNVWNQFDQRTVVLPDPVNIGLAVTAPSTGASAVEVGFEEFQFRAGGLATCSRLLEGSDGCKAHDNTHRMLAFLSMPLQ